MFPDHIRNHMISMIAEFTGTFMFLFFAFGIADIANLNLASEGLTSSNSQIILISFGFGFGVMVNVMCFYRISGGQLNPCVSLGLALVGAITPVRFLLNAISQLVAGMAAAGAISAMIPGPVNFYNTLGHGTSRTQGLFMEMFFTALLVMTVLLTAVEKSRFTYMAPLAIGYSLFIGHLLGVGTSGAGINPARSLGPCVAARYFPTYHWIYWVGPILGSFLAAGLWHLLQILDYTTCNPGQDDDGIAKKEN
ncbi:hypothetical protein CANCADRAFT_24920 [Tortispora caseinolytica NRRL Y-17796]|uniref:Aquaporin n=1 Tax=Tortispora caseinolytica NRRL Y-17796 TaxID=767744 RepID=A0A1E4TE44_9ASCO|nr:hypothetical protein CANCADRAFT_24920 [Tortispora caseinolytica NRRL Y-17796]